MESWDLKTKASRFHTLARGYGFLKRRRAKIYEAAAQEYARFAADTALRAGGAEHHSQSRSVQPETLRPSN